MLCSELLQPHVDYACNAWYMGEATVNKILQTAKNKTIRYLFKYDYRHRIGYSDFMKSNYLDVKSRVDYLALSL